MPGAIAAQEFESVQIHGGTQDASFPSIMVVGIGVDIVKIERIRNASERLFVRVCTLEERTYCDSFGPEGRFERYAGRFAAKEAVSKGLGTGIAAGVAWTDIEVLPTPSGAPRVVLHGAATAHLQRLGGQAVHLSISHDKESAVAMAVLESEPGDPAYFRPMSPPPLASGPA